MSAVPRTRLVETDADLEGILALQRASRAPTADGFVTVEHTLPILQAMHAIAPSVVGVDDANRVVAYALVMPRETAPLLPVLAPMFALLDALPPSTISTTSDPRWYIMGQIAVAPSHRGTGMFDALYAEHQRRYRDRYDVCITEISVRNPRSIRAHERVGFRTIHTYRDATDEWVVVALDLVP